MSDRASPGRTLRYFLPDAAATECAGQVLAVTRPSCAAVHLQGELGAGKSALARALLRALGVAGPIRSPSYTLVERYRLADGDAALHLDLYRIGDPGELEFLGIAEAELALWLVEWPERGGKALPPPDLRALLRIEGQGRGLELVAASAQGAGWLTRLAQDDRLQALSATG